jgi:tetratricopeptide (TPR) repeat protein
MTMPKRRQADVSGQSDAILTQALDLEGRGRLADAEALYRRLLGSDGRNFYALHQLALILLNRKESGARKESAEALELLATAVELRPDSAEALANFGLALQRTGNHEHALLAYDHAIAIDPKRPNPWINRASSLVELDRYEEAVANCDRAIVLAPDNASAHYNRANALYELARNEPALAGYARAIAINPNDPRFHFNEGITRLRVGDFRGGWPKYEWRWRRPETPQRNFTQPQWDGEAPLAGRGILLHAEQGFGDTIQFARYVPMVAALSGDVVLEVQPPLLDLFAGLPGAARVVAAGTALPPFDLQCPLLSLPLAFGTELATVPAPGAYLIAPPARVATWSVHMPPAPGPRVALCWSGSLQHKSDRHRSVAAEKLAPILSVPGVQLVSVQKDVRDSDRAFLAATSMLNFGQHMRDFADTAAILAMCDLVITVDTSIAHLAGALGRPTWVLLQHAPDFRWLMRREDSPWYPSVRLFRQAGLGDWDGVISRVTRELGLLAGHSSSIGNPT